MSGHGRTRECANHVVTADSGVMRASGNDPLRTFKARDQQRQVLTLKRTFAHGA